MYQIGRGFFLYHVRIDILLRDIVKLLPVSTDDQCRSVDVQTADVRSHIIMRILLQKPLFVND